jgi:hypothetical protein
LAEVTITGGTQGSVTVSRRELDQMSRALANLSKLMETALTQKQNSTGERACRETQGMVSMLKDMVYRWQQ